MRYCVAQGNPFDGVTLYGPFDTTEEADEWATANGDNLDWWIVDLNSPHDATLCIEHHKDGTCETCGRDVETDDQECRGEAEARKENKVD